MEYLAFVLLPCKYERLAGLKGIPESSTFILLFQTLDPAPQDIKG